MAARVIAGPEKALEVTDVRLSEDAALESMGYQQELKRSFSLLGMIGFSFSIVTSWTALSGVLIIGIESGGPPVIIWGWVGVCAASLPVAYALGEMCSAFPSAGGQYTWVSELAPKRFARVMSYICGWFMLIGIICMGAVNNFVGSKFILGIAALNYPTYGIQRWHMVLCAYLMTVMAIVTNIYLPRFLDKISRGVLFWNMGAFVVCFITILAMNDHKQSASFVFSQFQNETGWGPAYAAVLGILQASFGMCCYDAPAHMVEEMQNARREAPRAMVMSVYIGAITGFAFLVALCYCIGDLATTASSPTGVPLVEIFLNSTNSIPGTSAMISLIVVITVFCANSLMAEGSRAVYAFARDSGLPFSPLLRKVHPGTHVPIPAVLLTALVQMAFNSIYFGTVTGFNTIVAIATQGFYLSYAIPITARLLHRKPLKGPFSLGRFSMPLNLVAAVYLLFACVSFNLPSVRPITAENMNYTSAATGVVGLLAAVYWALEGRKVYTGPSVESAGGEKSVDNGDTKCHQI